MRSQAWSRARKRFCSMTLLTRFSWQLGPPSRKHHTSRRKFDPFPCVAFRSAQRNLPSTILTFGPMLSVALNEHETQPQGEQQDTCPARFKTYAALY